MKKETKVEQKGQIGNLTRLRLGRMHFADGDVVLFVAWLTYV